MSHTAAVTDDVQALVTAFQMFVQFHFHFIDLDFHTVEQGIVIVGTGGEFVQCVYHLDDTV